MNIYCFTELVKTNYMSQNWENLITSSNKTLKTPENTTRLNHSGHSSCLDVFLYSEFSRSGIVSSTVSAHEMVYAVNGEGLVKHNAKIRDYGKLENHQSSVEVVFYLQNSLIKKRTSEQFVFGSEAWRTN